MQRWDNFDQRLLLGYHAVVAVDNINYERQSGLYASLGLPPTWLGHPHACLQLFRPA